MACLYIDSMRKILEKCIDVEKGLYFEALISKEDCLIRFIVSQIMT